MASAKLAKRRVNQSHREMASTNPLLVDLASGWPMTACTHRTKVRALPTQTVNITGFLSWWAGLSLVSAPRAARRTMAVSNRGRGCSSPKVVEDRMCRTPLRTGKGVRRPDPGPGPG